MGVLPVIGGTAADFPDLVALRDASGTLLCSGTLIAPDAVLTAGHCARTDLVTAGGIAVRGMAPFPDAAATEDVAVIFLATPATVAPRALATGWAAFEIVDGASAVVAGYGTTGGSTLPPGPLQAGLGKGIFMTSVG